MSTGALLFGDDFTGPAGSKPNPALWNATNRTLHSGTVCDGLTGIQLDGKGNLEITARKIKGTWHSGELVGKVSYKGSRHLETRAQVAAGDGTWSAPLWEWAYPYGSSGVENDVCEQLGKQQGYHTTLHAAGGSEQATFLNDVAVDLAAGFHIYGCDVHADHADYFLDGKLVRTITRTSGGLGGRWPFLSTPMCSLVDLDMGGWGGPVSIPGPVSMLVDYVHVYALSA